MAKPHLPYILSLEADKDLEDIFDFTTDKFGQEQAITYLDGLENALQGLSANPKLGRERNEIRKGLRSLNKESHVVFYRILKDHIRVVRILHTSRDIIRFLPPTD